MRTLDLVLRLSLLLAPTACFSEPLEQPLSQPPAPPASAAPACDKARWEVPSVSRAELDRHDLKWIGCELTACGPVDRSPSPGMPQEDVLLCDPARSDAAPVQYLGFIHPNQSGAFTTANVVSTSTLAWLHGPRYVYKHGESTYIFTAADQADDQLNVFYTARALELLRTRYPSAYDRLIVRTASFPSEPVLDKYRWKNRIRSVVISFDNSPNTIAASATALDTAPKSAEGGLQEYANAAVISLQRETILGRHRGMGSQDLYRKDNPDESYLRYMREGLIETLVHELLHRAIDRAYSVDAKLDELYSRRGDASACEVNALEETLVASASLVFFRQAGGISNGYLDYYDKVLDDNRNLISKCPDYARWSAQFARPSAVAARYDLRLVDLR